MTQRDLTLFFVWCWLELKRKSRGVMLRNQRYASRHPERIIKQKHASYLARRKAHAAYQKKWVADNPDRNRKLKREWNAKQRRENIGWRIRTALSVRVWGALKFTNRGAKKTLELLGCTVDELKRHLQIQFRPGMTWDNYGEWHIDHIRPCASFDLTDPEQQRQCFNFKNLQPLWAKDNLSKGAKYNAS